MNKKTKTLIALIFLLTLISTTCLAVDTGDYKDVGDVLGGGNFITNTANAVFRAVQIAGVAVSVIYISILGMKYMTSSIDDRADIKKRLVPFVIGAAIFFGVTFIMELIIDIASWI